MINFSRPESRFVGGGARRASSCRRRAERRAVHAAEAHRRQVVDHDRPPVVRQGGVLVKLEAEDVLANCQGRVEEGGVLEDQPDAEAELALLPRLRAAPALDALTDVPASASSRWPRAGAEWWWTARA
jgi:hypothetical protein